MCKDELVDKILNCLETTARNSMGCSENWYNPYYAIRKTFTATEIAGMSLKELNDLIKLAGSIGDALY